MRGMSARSESARSMSAQSESAQSESYGRRRFLTAAAALGGAAAPTGRPRPASAAPAATWEDVINGSFGSYSAFESEWNYLYPWGSDHNGSARMYGSANDHNHIYLGSGVLTLKASRITW